MDKKLLKISEQIQKIGFVQKSESRFGKTISKFCNSSIKRTTGLGLEEFENEKGRREEQSNDLMMQDDKNQVKSHVKKILYNIKTKGDLKSQINFLKENTYPDDHLDMIQTGCIGLLEAVGIYSAQQQKKVENQDKIRQSDSVQNTDKVKDLDVIHLIITHQSSYENQLLYEIEIKQAIANLQKQASQPNLVIARQSDTQLIEQLDMNSQISQKNNSLPLSKLKHNFTRSASEITQDDEQEGLSNSGLAFCQQKMDDINDVNRILKHKVANFKTIFIRYRAKNDVNLIKEISDMNLNLGDSGTELKANAKDIQRVINDAFKKCQNNPQPNQINDSIQDVDENRQRLIMVTCSLTEKVTEHSEAYGSLLKALILMAKDNIYLQDNDFISFNVGSPLLKTYIRTDNQVNLPKFKEVFRLYADFIGQVRDSSSTYRNLKRLKSINFEQLTTREQQEQRQMVNEYQSVMRMQGIVRIMISLGWIVVFSILFHLTVNSPICAVYDGNLAPYLISDKDKPIWIQQHKALEDFMNNFQNNLAKADTSMTNNQVQADTSVTNNLVQPDTIFTNNSVQIDTSQTNNLVQADTRLKKNLFQADTGLKKNSVQVDTSLTNNLVPADSSLVQQDTSLQNNQIQPDTRSTSNIVQANQGDVSKFSNGNNQSDETVQTLVNSFTNQLSITNLIIIKNETSWINQTQKFYESFGPQGLWDDNGKVRESVYWNFHYYKDPSQNDGLYWDNMSIKFEIFQFTHILFEFCVLLRMVLKIVGFKLKRFKLIDTILFSFTLLELIMTCIETKYVLQFEGQACLGGYQSNHKYLQPFITQSGYNYLSDIQWYQIIVLIKLAFFLMQIVLQELTNIINNAKTGNNSQMWFN